ncbi:DUF3320 domain-containing protein [Nocardioides fonticola]|uniref:DUF3320 domain-containing protein n=1 Tax=Nocardioides fonticola TaxID=450363 RepID=A0ABP7Y359_9ACTN
MPPVSISFTVTDPVSYAQAHNGIQPVAGVEIVSDVEAHGAELAIELRDDEGSLTRPFTRAVDLAAGQVSRVDVSGLQLDAAALLQSRETRRGVARLVLSRDGETLAEATRDLNVLAANHWRSRPEGLAFELLSAYVMPNDPAISTLLVEAAALLQEATGRSALDGYQSGSPERVDAIVEAVWNAAQRRSIRYAEPPASWADEGQKVRTPTEVLEGGLGTCLDTTVVLAAALEQAGLRPLLWVIEGHAFLGYWRGESALDAVRSEDSADVVNLIDLGAMRLVETTLVTDDSHDAPLANAHAAALRHLDGTSAVLAIVDVWRARRAQIRPLPARRVQADGSVEVHEYRPQEDAERRLVIEYAGDRPDRAVADPAPPRVRQWKNSLLDLSLRNRLINYTDRAGISVLAPEGLLPQIEDLVNAGRPLSLRAIDFVDAIDRERGVPNARTLDQGRLSSLLVEKQALFADLTSETYQSRLRSLAYKARTLEEETGANNLYLALGSLSWKLDDRELRSPLILVPVRLTTTSRGQVYRLVLDESGASTPNFCLLEKLRASFGLQIPGLANPVEDQSGIDLAAALEATRVAIAEAGLSFRVNETADLAILQFAKFRLWKDLDENWEALMANPLVKHLVETPSDIFVDPTPAPVDVDLDALDAVSPVPADASQLEAVADAVAGRTFVLEGPPGTGKSQTITNLLTRAVADGRRVLFVAEKRAALDVVADRLASVGMAPFSLDLHDKASKPAVVRAHIKRAIEHAVQVDEQGHHAAADDLKASRRILARYAERLHEPNAAGLSFYSARTQLLTLGEQGPAFEVPRAVVTGSVDLDALRAAIGRLPDPADLARPGLDHPWGFVRLRSLDGVAIEQVRSAARAVDAALTALLGAGQLGDVVRAADSSEDLRALAALVERHSRIEVLDAARTPAWQQSSAGLAAEIARFVAASHPGLDVLTPAALDLPVADLAAQSQAAEDAGFFKRKKLRQAVFAQLQPVLREGQTIKLKKVDEVVTALAQVHGAVRGLAGQAGAIPGLEIPESWNPFTEAGQQLVDRQVEWLRWAGAVVDTSSERRFTQTLRQWLATNAAATPDQAAAVSSLAESLGTLTAQLKVDPAVLTAWSGEIGFAERWQRSTDRRRLDEPELLSLRRWVDFEAALAPLEAAGMTAAAQALRTAAIDADEAVQAFQRGLAITSVAERRDASGLDGFDPQAHEKAVARFSRSLRDARGQMASVAPAQVLSSRTFQTSNSTGRIGELKREIGRQRGGLGVRALMEKYGDLVVQLMPCVLVSPDSVARFFPVGGVTFDLVVFDEASQIRVADAIGAMGRGTAVVIVGDSKQMPPTSFAETAIGTDDDTLEAELSATEDQESILEEAISAQVPKRLLTWHYRSQDESLIAFSNIHYYDSRLSSFPAPAGDPGSRLAHGRGISLVRVNGEFQRSGKGKLLRTNPVEAEAIFEDVKRRFAASPDATPSLGVVTFNQQQRAYIENLIRDSQDERLLEALDGVNGEGLFIKNLENVQGDERDVILFSTAFSVNEKGVLPLNFGPLTRAGGERRLNVAITRARRQVVIYSSFDPEQIRIEQTQSVGVAHLRAYMELAARGTAALEANGQIVAVPDRHRDEVAARLRAAGLAVTTDVGLSDFRIDLVLARPEAPETPLVAVLFDGPGWSKRRTVGDRDGLPLSVLRGLMKWPAVERVWMPAWISDPDAVIAHLADVVARAAAGPITEPEPPAPEASPTTATSSVSAPEPVAETQPAPTAFAAPDPAHDLTGSTPAAALASAISQITTAAVAPGVTTPAPASGSGVETPFVEFVPRPVGPRSVLDDLPAASAAARVRGLIHEIVQAEGPIHVERLARHVAACYDLTRLSPARISTIASQVSVEMLKTPDEPFAWPLDLDPATWRGYRPDPASLRQLEHISMREVANVMQSLCRNAAGLSDDELIAETVVVFGMKRRTSGVRSRLESTIGWALEASRLVRIEGRLEAGRSA